MGKTQDRLLAQRSPDLKEIFQELVDNPNRTNNSRVLLFLFKESGDSKRSALAYDQVKAHAPQVFLYYSLEAIVAPEAPQNVVEVSADESVLSLTWDAQPKHSSGGYYIFMDGERVNDFPQPENMFSIEKWKLVDGTTFNVSSINKFLMESEQSETYTYEIPVIVPPLSLEATSTTLFPNPVKDVLNLQMKHLQSWEVKDLAGRQHVIYPMSDQGKTTLWSVAHLPVGLYFLKTTDMEGNQLTYKFLRKD